MINKRQFKVSWTLGAILTIVHLTHAYQNNNFQIMQDFIKIGYWYVPAILIFLKLFIYSSSIYLIFRVVNYTINFFRK
ncbi:hypothetical protein FC40_GL001261 [Ligilactobacillus hayakitensis DSM 18933 = JCM 14209]|uniref:Acyltransferase 3 domain-containing protein n=1 Tax=Ligilactobacillus hayakitensis DSM 18933 = JCM 14209 TaxID=1423755 RepID=A0A0R1WQ85_9LACO|nr:hypothetical protein FC40_GL001261 [Ligilactobacillus hayakitensis DSM 18933 = JCM 14209]